MQETQVWSLDWEDLLEKEMVIHSIILAWELNSQVAPSGLQSTGLQNSSTWLSDLTTTTNVYVYIYIYTYIYPSIHTHKHMYIIV